MRRRSGRTTRAAPARAASRGRPPPGRSRAARSVSPTSSSRLRARMAARTWVESVRWRPRALSRPRSLQRLEQRVQEQPFGPAGDQAAAELAEHGVVEAGIGQLQAEGVLPVDAAADGVGGLAIGEVLGELQDGDQGEPPGGVGGLSARGKQVGEVVVRVEDARARRASGGRGCPWGRRRGRRGRSLRGRGRRVGAAGTSAASSWRRSRAACGRGRASCHRRPRRPWRGGTTSSTQRLAREFANSIASLADT